MTTVNLQNGNKLYLGTCVDPAVMRGLDNLRGEIPRSRIVERALKQFLEREMIGDQQNETSK
jgi:predicted transcriptional regulator